MWHTVYVDTCTYKVQDTFLSSSDIQFCTDLIFKLYGVHFWYACRTYTSRVKRLTGLTKHEKEGSYGSFPFKRRYSVIYLVEEIKSL